MSVQTDLAARVVSLRNILDNSNEALTEKGGEAVESLTDLPTAIQNLPSGGASGIVYKGIVADEVYFGTYTII